MDSERTYEDGEVIHIDDLCKTYLGYDTRRYRQLAKQGHVPEPSRGYIPRDEAIKSFIQYQKGLIEGRADDETDRLKRKKLSAEADIKVLILAKMRGENISVTKATHLWGLVVTAIKTLLQSIPSSISPALLSCKELREIEALLEKSIERVLNECSNPDLAEFARMEGYTEGIDGPETPKKTDGKRVRGKKHKAVKKIQ